MRRRLRVVPSPTVLIRVHRLTCWHLGLGSTSVFRSLGFRSLGLRSLGLRCLGLRSLAFCSLLRVLALLLLVLFVLLVLLLLALAALGFLPPKLFALGVNLQAGTPSSEHALDLQHCRDSLVSHAIHVALRLFPHRIPGLGVVVVVRVVGWVPLLHPYSATALLHLQ